MPFRRRTLWRRDSLKSISPFIAISVIAFTCSSTPPKLASLLMISKSTIVISMSKTISRFSLRELHRSWITTSRPSRSQSRLISVLQSSASQPAKSMRNSMEMRSPRAVTDDLSTLTLFLEATSATSRMMPTLSLARIVTTCKFFLEGCRPWRSPREKNVTSTAKLPAFSRNQSSSTLAVTLEDPKSATTDMTNMPCITR